MIPKALLLTSLSLVFLLSLPAYGQKPTPRPANTRDAEIVVWRFDSALRGFNWAAASDLMHPEALAELKLLIRPLVASQPKSIGERVLEVSTLQKFDDLSGAEVFHRFMMTVASEQSRQANQDVVSPRRRIIGSVPEGDVVLHVVSRVLRPDTDVIAPEDVEVRTVKKNGANWRVMLPKNLRAVIAEWGAVMKLSVADVLRPEECDPEDIVSYAVASWKDDKNIRIEDAYKWLYQATRGAEHAAPNREAATKSMEQEWDGLGDPQLGEEIWQPLCKGGQIGRVNLRPYKKQGGSKAALLEAFLAGSREFGGSEKSFLDSWQELGKRLKAKKIGALTHAAWVKLDNESRTKGYPAISHSQEYNKARTPAYRLVTAERAAPLRRSTLIPPF